MQFHTFTFVYFFLITFALYLKLAHRAQNLVLLAASWVFYGAWDGRFLALLIASSTLDWGCALGIDRPGASPRRKKLLLTLSLGLNLSVLAVFKYLATRENLGWVLPVGVSFYTFQIMGYVIDVYRGRIKAERDWLDYQLFVAFFPQLVAGPIERAKNLLTQVKLPRQVTWQGLSEGSWLLLLGFFKKVVVADNLAPYVFKLKPALPILSGGEAALYYYTIVWYVYADFSGYSDIARGAGKLMGFELMANFRMPFFAKNPADFWRRWNISLSDWFRDYVFTPMSRMLGKPLARNRYYLAFCAFATLTLCGLWHGAAWNFVLFGAMHGLILVGYYMVRPFLRRMGWNRVTATRLGALVSGFIAFHFYATPTLLFFVSTPRDALAIVEMAIRNAWTSDALMLFAMMGLVGLPMLAIDWWQNEKDDLMIIKTLPVWGRTTIYVLLFAMIVLCGETGTHAFVYFQF